MKRLTIAALALTGLLAASAFACGGGCGPQGGMGGPNFGMMDALWSLDLSADQENKLDKIVREHRKAMIDLGGEMQDSQRLEGFGKDKFDRKAFVKAKEEPFEKMMKARADFFEQIHAVLTPAQRETFAASAVSCGGPKGDRRGPGNYDQKGKRWN